MSGGPLGRAGDCGGIAAVPAAPKEGYQSELRGIKVGVVSQSFALWKLRLGTSAWAPQVSKHLGLCRPMRSLYCYTVCKPIRSHLPVLGGLGAQRIRQSKPASKPAVREGLVVTVARFHRLLRLELAGETSARQRGKVGSALLGLSELQGSDRFRQQSYRSHSAGSGLCGALWAVPWALSSSPSPAWNPTRWSMKVATWLILPVVICLSQRLSHACLSISCLYCETANGSLNQL